MTFPSLPCDVVSVDAIDMSGKHEVEISVNFEYPATIPLVLDDKLLELQVEYQWKAAVCDNCKVFGHTVKSCVKQKKIKWVPKRNFKPVVADKETVLSDKEPETVNLLTMGNEEEVSPTANDFDGSQRKTADVSKGEVTLQQQCERNIGTERSTVVCSQVVQQKGSRPSASTEGPRVGGLDTTLLGDKEGEWTKVKSKAQSPKKIGATEIGKVHKGAGIQVGSSSGSGDRVILSSSNEKGASSPGTAKKSGKSPAISGTGAPSSSNDKGASSPGAAKELGQSAVIQTGNLTAGSFRTEKDKMGTEVEDDWKVVKGRKQSTEAHHHSPKKNPFMVFSDFKSESRFPINRKKEDEEFERMHKFLSEEEKVLKKQEREMRRLNWSGNSSIKAGSESSGRGYRSQQRKTSLLHQ